jgi:hypothetical protein
MKAADLAQAQKLAATLALLRDTVARLDAGERLRLTLGSESAAREIELSPVYLATIRGNVAALAGRIAVAVEDLAALGVEA